MRRDILFKEALHKISENIEFDTKTRVSAVGYYKKMCNIENKLSRYFGMIYLII